MKYKDFDLEKVKKMELDINSILLIKTLEKMSAMEESIICLNGKF